MANVSLHTDGDAVGHRRGDARTLEEHVDKWAARRMLAGVPARRCVLPFLTGAPKAVECRLCSKIIYAGEGLACSVKKCPQMFHLNCVVKDTPNFTAESFRCPQHGCVVCKQNMFFWRCVRCTVAAHTRCAPWPVTRLNDDQVSAICWRHPSDWLLQNKNAELTNNIEEVFCRLPLPYVNGDFNIDSTIRDFSGDVCRPPPYTSIRHSILSITCYYMKISYVSGAVQLIELSVYLFFMPTQVHHVITTISLICKRFVFDKKETHWRSCGYWVHKLQG